MTSSPNPATHANRLHLVLARDVEPRHAPAGDAGEDVTLVRVPCREALDLARRGKIVHASHIGFLLVGLEAGGHLSFRPECGMSREHDWEVGWAFCAVRLLLGQGVVIEGNCGRAVALEETPMSIVPDLFGTARLTHLTGRVEEVISKVDRLLEIAYAEDVRGEVVPRANLSRFRRSPRGFSGANVAVAGIFKTRCGLQRAADLTHLQIKATSPSACAVDLSEPLGAPITLDRSDVTTPDHARRSGVSDVVISLNPPLFTTGLQYFIEPNGERPNIIGYWVWELNKVTQDWHFAASLCDEIWAPSEFVRSTLATELTDFKGAIKTVPYAVDLDPMAPRTPQSRTAARSRFDLAEDDFVVGTTFSFRSCYSRKNPTAAIDAFWEAFGIEGAASVKLLIRCTDGDIAPTLMKHLASYAREDPRVWILPGDRGACPIKDFYHGLDAYISLHRSEGYGLTLVEAAQVGLPVVTTGWGLAADIEERPSVHPVDYRLVFPIDYQNLYGDLEGAVWAEPDTKQAGTKLREIYEETRSKAQA